MKKLTILTTVLVLSVFMSIGFSAQINQVQPKTSKAQMKCPICNHAMKTPTKYFIDYNGQRIYACGPGCLEKLKANPEKFLSASQKSAPSENAKVKTGKQANTNSKCPMMKGKAANKTMAKCCPMKKKCKMMKNGKQANTNSKCPMMKGKAANKTMAKCCPMKKKCKMMKNGKQANANSKCPMMKGKAANKTMTKCCPMKKKCNKKIKMKNTSSKEKDTTDKKTMKK